MKGKVIYTIATILLIALMFLPNHMALFSMKLSELQLSNWKILMPDFLSAVIILVLYALLRIFYKKHSIYIKIFPIYVFIVLILWTWRSYV